MCQFEIYRDDAGQHRWRLRATNGLIVAESGEGYARRRGAERGIDILKQEAAAAPVVQLIGAKPARSPEGEINIEIRAEPGLVHELTSELIEDLRTNGPIRQELKHHESSD